MSIGKSLFAVTMGVLMMSGAAFAELELKPYGDAQYRFRGNLDSHSDDDNSQSGAQYFNMFAWRTGVRAKVDDQLSLQFQIGNNWSASESVTYGNTQRSRTAAPVLVHLAYGTWNPGAFFISAGVIPVNSHGALDLLAHSLHSDYAGYAEASYDGWSTFQNNNLMAFKVGAPVVTGDVKVGAELTTSVILSRGTTYYTSDLSRDADANISSVLLVIDVPISAGDLKVTPQMAMVLNRHYAPGNGDHEMIFGASAAYKVNPLLSLNLSGAYGMISNENSNGGTATEEFNGLLLGVGGSYRAGPGSVMLDYKISTNENKKVDDSDVAYHYIDARYSMKVHSNFTIMPRWRTYITVPNSDANNGYTFMRNRPELILTASF
ncbi:MAG: hypothetical protein FWE57_03630 [Chitinispirillia bacterium]|nr:hypothetical protein [Chitinispirillia bacterium]